MLGRSEGIDALALCTVDVAAVVEVLDQAVLVLVDQRLGQTSVQQVAQQLNSGCNIRNNKLISTAILYLEETRLLLTIIRVQNVVPPAQMSHRGGVAVAEVFIRSTALSRETMRCGAVQRK